MRTKTGVALGVVAIAAGAAAIAAGVAGASTGGDDHEVPITGDALERATAAALDHLGEGRVTETEQGDEDSFYEVEVTLNDGREVDVQLDEAFNVVSSEVDGPDGPNDD